MSLLPDEWVEIILGGLRSSGVWADFQCDLDRWNRYYKELGGRYILETDFPPQPQIEDYSADVTTERTRCNYDPEEAT